MDDESKRRREAGRGQAAAELMANPLLAEAFAAVEQGYIEAWASNRSPDGGTLRLGPEGRERLWHAVQTVRKVREALADVVATGEMARRQIEEASAVKRPWYVR